MGWASILTADRDLSYPDEPDAFMTFRIPAMVIVVLASRGAALAAQDPRSILDVLLHSSSVSEQRGALVTVLATPREYVPRIRQALQTYAKQLEKDPVAANRAVYVAALVRDASFIPILVKLLDDPNVIDECIYSCAPVFALSVFANFGGWRIPASLNSNRAPASDLRSSMQWVPRLTLEKRPVEEVVQGALLQELIDVSVILNSLRSLYDGSTLHAFASGTAVGNTPFATRN